MHFLVTGGCGFIGAHLSRALIAAGHRVRILDNLSTGKKTNAPAEADIVVGDVADADAVAQAVRDVDGIFHLAAVASVQRCNEEWLATHRSNLTGTVTILDAAARSDKKIPVVYASSAAVYGDNTNLPLREDAATVPLTAYGQDKLSGEHYARIAHRVHHVPSVGLRFFNVYGPGQDPSSPYSGVISRFIDAAKAGNAVTIYGDGEQSRDFIFVSDIVRLLMQAMENVEGRSDVFNGATGTKTSLLLLIATIESIVGTQLEKIFAPARAGDIRHSLGDGHHAKKALGFSATTSLADGLKATMEAAHA